MSFQVRNDRREGSRIPVRNSNRQEWIPRGGAVIGSGGGGDGAGSSSSIIPPPTSSFFVITRIIMEEDIVGINNNYNGNPTGGGGYGGSGGGGVYGDGGGNSYHNPVQFESRFRGNFTHHHQRRSNVLNSNLPQLVQEIQDKLTKGTVECMICYDMVRRSAPIWSCSSCYSIFHMNCIKKWARAPNLVDLSAEKNQGLNWRCPGCQSVQLLTSKEIRYLCFCGKRPDPPSDLYLTPHSCGEHCGKPLEKQMQNGDDEDRCPHACVLQCHPGPCPPCKAFAPACALIGSLFTCRQLCHKVLECWRHHCKKICHTGPCESCEVPMDASCFCKKKKEVVLCGEMSVKGELIGGGGVFPCNSICSKTLVCGNYTCGEVCHPGQCGECEVMPGNIKSCPYGKTLLQKERTLPCQVHRCKEMCHVGDSSLCVVTVNQKCRCGSSSRLLNATKRRRIYLPVRSPVPLSDSNSRYSGWDPHLCSMLCGKKLRCGQHSCESLCHSSHYPPCPETIFIDLACACGKTSLPPPQPCGTPAPSCQQLCSVPQPCGHPSSHGCHFGDCPPCSFPVAKECTGGHVILRNIPCGSKEIRCNQFCGKTRQCGMRACGRKCRPPPCDTSCTSVSGSRSTCGQVCGAPRRGCKHTCTSSCHSSSPCPGRRCEFPMTITCLCGRISAAVASDAGGNSGGFASNTVSEAHLFQKLPVPLKPVEANGNKMERQKKLAHRCKFLVLGKGKGNTSNGLRVHVFCAMFKEKRDAVNFLKLSVHSAGWGPNRFLVVHVTTKSKAPARILGVKDMDQRLVVALLDLPMESNVNALVLRFGGECELVWLDEFNALAFFSDPGCADTALRRLDHESACCCSYCTNSQSMEESSCAGSFAGRRLVGVDQNWIDNLADIQDNLADIQITVWRGKETPIMASINRCDVLDQDSVFKSSAVLSSGGVESRPGNCYLQYAPKI
ncbi:hypothetical protein MKW98_005638 [Papaver atlanticum]|uniref:NF-X1-type zinc finger protein NFXL1 n=1 Tax=Papaver atlanticum TaxID=357466 RepID=A0AAD4SSE6_9MAGN|nr:hypothetical protein MKW98_005638 [Papaver atlanticum]